MGTGAARTFTADVQRHAAEAKAARQRGPRRRGRVQAKQPAAAGAAEMNVLRMFGAGVGRGKTEQSPPVGGLVRQADIGEPVKNAIDGDTINTGKLVAAQQFFDIPMAEGRFGRLEQSENPDARSCHAPASRTDGGLYVQ